MEKKKHLALRLTERPLRLNGVGIKRRLGSKPDAAVAADESAGSSDSIPSKMDTVIGFYSFRLKRYVLSTARLE